MKRHPKSIIAGIRAFRRRGYSIGELVIKFSVPKTTVWQHIRDVSVPPRYIPLLRAKYGGSKQRAQRLQIAMDQRATELLRGRYRHLAMAFAMLYWGEGSKKACEFINSDGEMIKVYLLIVRRILGLPEESIRPTLRIFTGMNQTECLNHWSRVTGIAKSKFVVRLNDGGTRGKTRYGMCRITIMRGSTPLKLAHALIQQSSQLIQQELTG